MKGKKGDQSLTKQLCLGKETIYQKTGRHICSEIHQKTDTQRSEASAISASTAGETIRHSGAFASSPFVWKRLNSTDKYWDTNEWCLSL